MRALPSPEASEKAIRAWSKAILGALVGVAGLAVLVRVSHGPSALAAADLRPLPLVVAALCSALVPTATAAAWRRGLSALGEPLTRRRAWSCYGLGSLANSCLPAKLGEPVRIEAFARCVDHPRRRWLVGGISAAIAFCQSTVFAVVVTLGAISGALPYWALLPALGVPALLLTAGTTAVRRRLRGRLESLVVATTFSLSTWARLLAWISASSLARFLLAVAVLDAFSAPHPLTGATVAIASHALGSAVPFAPGGAGVPALTMAVGLTQAGLDPATSAGVALLIHTFETAACVIFGLSGWLVLRVAPDAADARVVARPATASIGS